MPEKTLDEMQKEVIVLNKQLIETMSLRIENLQALADAREGTLKAQSRLIHSLEDTIFSLREKVESLETEMKFFKDVAERSCVVSNSETKNPNDDPCP